MRSWMSRALFVSSVAAFVALLVTSCTGCSAQAQERRPAWAIRPLSPTGDLRAPRSSVLPMREAEIIYDPVDPCTLDGSWWIKVFVFGCW